jgi:hypothetical protein
MQRITSAGRGAMAAATAVARHAIWYVRYHLDGTARARRNPPPNGPLNGR